MDEIVRVADSEIVNALRVLIQRAKLAAEPSGGASLAALLSGRASPAADSTVVCVISGGNVAPGRLEDPSCKAVTPPGLHERYVSSPLTSYPSAC